MRKEDQEPLFCGATPAPSSLLASDMFEDPNVQAGKDSKEKREGVLGTRSYGSLEGQKQGEREALDVPATGAIRVTGSTEALVDPSR